MVPYFWTRKRHVRCCCCCACSWGCCYQIFKVLRLCRFSIDRYETFRTCQRQYSAAAAALQQPAVAAAALAALMQQRQRAARAAPQRRYLANGNEVRVSGSDSYALLFLFIVNK